MLGKTIYNVSQSRVTFEFLSCEDLWLEPKNFNSKDCIMRSIGRVMIQSLVVQDQINGRRKAE